MGGNKVENFSENFSVNFNCKFFFFYSSLHDLKKYLKSKTMSKKKKKNGLTIKINKDPLFFITSAWERSLKMGTCPRSCLLSNKMKTSIHFKMNTFTIV